jgi:integrase
MRGSIKQRSTGSWTLTFDLGYASDPATGQRRRRQKRVTVRGTKRQAQAHLTDLLRAANRGELVEPSKRTVGEWLTEWLDKAIKPPAKRPGTYRTYAHVVQNRLIPALGAIPLQEVKAADIKRYYTESKLSGSTLAQHHAVVHSALKAATLEGLVFRNVAALVIGKPRWKRDHADVARNCWEADEARTFLAAAKQAGPQPAGLYALALDSGARKNELCGLQWGDLDLEKGTVTIMRQLAKPGRGPEFGPVKNGVPRTVDLAAETIELLKAHKRAQAELKMRNRRAYHDLGLVFAKEWGDLHGREDSLGLPLQSNNLGQREFARILKEAKVRPITIHGLRHTSATLLLKAGVPAHVVQQRLGHKRVEITLGIYAHVLPSMQQDAARRLGSLLYGSSSS